MRYVDIHRIPYATQVELAHDPSEKVSQPTIEGIDTMLV